MNSRIQTAANEFLLVRCCLPTDFNKASEKGTFGTFNTAFNSVGGSQDANVSKNNSRYMLHIHQFHDSVPPNIKFPSSSRTDNRGNWL